MNKYFRLKFFILVLLIGAGWFSFTGFRVGLKVEKMEPRELVQTYYDSIARGDRTTARACLGSSYRRQVSGSADWDGKNVKTLSNLTLGKSIPIQLQNVKGETLQLTADYEVKYKQVITNYDGHSTRFIYVNRKDNGPWKIISIGTGP